MSEDKKKSVEDETRKTGGLDVGPPEPRVDDETDADEAKTTKRQD